MSGLPGIGEIGGLFHEVDDPAGLVHVHHAEARRLRARDLDAADGHVGAGGDVLLQHDLVVLLVDVVAGENDDVLRVVALDDVDVLRHGVGGAEIPLVLGHALRGRQDVEALVALGAEEVPAVLEVPDQAVRLVLGGDGDAPDPGVQGVRQREIDDPALAAEVDGRLGASVGQFLQAAPASPGEDESHRGSSKTSMALRMIAHESPPNVILDARSRPRR